MTFEHIVQGGALALLSYLIWWGTQTGVPSIVSSLQSINTSIQENSQKLEQFEAKLEKHSAQIASIVDRLERRTSQTP